ncbi:muts domain V-domain-containing protein [Lentinula raphanica]|nr:muts domain V-domain-containing protein [Lentinula raphanica]
MMWSNQGSSRPASRRPLTAGQNRPRTGQSRPWTGQSRVSTARPQTSASTRYEGSFVIALLEGRGLGREVGLAALDADTGRVVLVQVREIHQFASNSAQHSLQLSDCQTYVKTLHQMHLHKPSLILVPDTFLSASDAALSVIGGSNKRTTNSSLLVEFIRDEFPDVDLEPVPRKYWNETSGLEFIQQLCVEDDERAGTILAVSSKYYALSACSALFKHSEIRRNTRFSAGSLRIQYTPVDGTMMIDPETSRNLELVGNMSHRKSYHSLFGILNHTYTAMAARLLRVNILAPITVQSSIDARLDVVEEFVQDEDLFNEARTALKTLKNMDFDKLIGTLAASETVPSNSAKAASNRVSQMLNLRNVVRNIPLLTKALESSKSQLLRIIHEMLSDERIDKIDSLIRESLNEDTAPTKNGIAAVNARVYAVKANYNRLLDVARETYKENVGDIYALCNTLTQTHELPLTLVYQETGFIFSLRKADLEGELPKGFINVTLKKGKWQFSSMELKKMNARMQDALDETLILSDKIIQDLVTEILVSVGALYKASEAVALVDMLWAFAHSAIMHNYVRPEFTGTLAVKSGRHPILETVQSAGTLVPNDVFCDDSSSFQIIQGPNMSGKSTYLRQVALLSVMAMCGSFVPAEYASFRIHDALLTRLSNDDDLEKSLSTFASEMATSAMILGLATDRSLVLVDELGRGTSPREGIGISHAIAEGLIEQKCFVFFATHFAELSTTLSRQPSVVNLHLAVQRTSQSASNFGMTFQYKIVDGAPEGNTHYGLELARLADLPSDVLTEASRVSKRLAELQTRHQEQSESSKIAMRRKALLKLRTNLTQAFEHSALPDEELLSYIGRFQADITKVFLYSNDTD